MCVCVCVCVLVTHVVTYAGSGDSSLRTYKLLCGMATGKWVLQFECEFLIYAYRVWYHVC